MVASGQTPTDHPPEPEVRPDRERIYIVPPGELSIATADSVQARFDELLAAGFQHLIVDLRGVLPIDTAGVRVLLRGTDRARRRSARFSVVVGSQHMADHLRMRGVLDRLDVIPA